MKCLLSAGMISLLIVLASTAEGAVRSLRELSPDESLKLAQSEQRVDVYDHALRTLDVERNHRQISRQQFQWRQRDLVAFIGAEARYQNDLLTKNSGFAEDAREVWQNIAKYSIEVPAYLACIALKGMSGSSFSP